MIIKFERIQLFEKKLYFIINIWENVLEKKKKNFFPPVLIRTKEIELGKIMVFAKINKNSKTFLSKK